jgi:hypothetical protein
MKDFLDQIYSPQFEKLLSLDFEVAELRLEGHSSRERRTLKNPGFDISIILLSRETAHTLR